MPERFLHFFEMHGTEFKFIDTISGENVARAKDRIVARIMRLLELAIQSISSGPVEEGGDVRHTVGVGGATGHRRQARFRGPEDYSFQGAPSRPAR